VCFGRDVTRIRLNDEKKTNCSHCLDFYRQARLLRQLRWHLARVRLIAASFVVHVGVCLLQSFSYEVGVEAAEFWLPPTRRAVHVSRLISEAVAGTVRVLSWFEQESF
jgi:hypothetical protein